MAKTLIADDAELLQETHPVRVLVVDDSAYMRFTLTKHLNEAPGFIVVGAARDGRDALDMIPKIKPDVVTLDIEMPRLDGLSTLREIMSACPMPVVMLSSLTTEGARETVQALTLGAVDFVSKPPAKANVAIVMNEVIAKVRAAATAKVMPPTTSRHVPQPAPVARVASKPTRALRRGDKVVVVGASTGGPRALNTVVAALAPRLEAAFLIVQHMPVGFTRSLAERLDHVSPLAIKEAEPGDALEVGRGLLAPGGFHLTVNDHDLIELNQNPTVHGVRPAIDVTLASVAARYKEASVSVVLTGMGRDGTNGSILIHEAGGRVIAEDEETCVVWGMPRSVAEAGVAQVIAKLPDVAREVEKAVKNEQ
jgi:two-component system chemotaxis response regulator CheB